MIPAPLPSLLNCLSVKPKTLFCRIPFAGSNPSKGASTSIKGRQILSETNSKIMPRRSLWKGSFVDAFLAELKNKKDVLANKKIWSRRSSILPEFLNTTVRIYNGRNFVRCKVTEEKVGHKFGEFALTRKRRPLGGPKGKK